jgi:hypothetical protein
MPKASKKGRKAKKEAAARARAGLARRRLADNPVSSESSDEETAADSSDAIEYEPSDDDDCGYEGGVCELLSESSDEEDWDDSELGGLEASLEDIDVETLVARSRPLEGWELEGGDNEGNPQPTAFTALMVKHDKKTWTKATRALGYTGHSVRTQQRNAQAARAREKLRKDAKTSAHPQIAMMRSFAAIKKPPHPPPQLLTMESIPPAQMVDYLSDYETDSSVEDDWDDVPTSPTTVNPSPTLNRLPSAPPLKRQRLEVPIREQRRQKQAERAKQLNDALLAIKKLIRSKKTIFAGGPTGLQAYRARAIESHLTMMVKRKRGSGEAALRAAESHGFSEVNGSRDLARWTREWVEKRELPVSQRGCHSKVYSLLEEPGVKAELRAYVRSNKWAMDPGKLAEFTKGQMIPKVAKEYAKELAENEMPRGLQKYVQIELFPRVQLQCKRGISLVTARRWLRSEGFRFISFKKEVYFDGHERADVVAYRQNVFLPEMEKHWHRLVHYEMGDVDKESETHGNYIEKRLVLVAQDEMTAQANDSAPKSWVFEKEHRLRKKGPGRGLHQSDVICSTVGWLQDASQTMEYGKNYEGYWNGEMFVNQIEVCSHTITYSKSQSYDRPELFQPLRQLTAPDIRH